VQTKSVHISLKLLYIFQRKEILEESKMYV
jgi:hypothetical protein